MFSSNWLARVVYGGATLISLFLFPWWLTAAWCLVGCLLFPLFVEAVIVAAVLDSTFLPGGVPVLMIIAIGVITGMNAFYFDSTETYDEDFL